MRSTPLYTLEAAFDARKKEVAFFVTAAVLAALLGLGVLLDLRRRQGRGRAGKARRRPGSRTAPRARNGHPGPAEHATVPRMRLQPVPPRDPAVSLMVWQTPDDSLTCEEPGDDWVYQWTYGVSLGQDAAPRFVLTGERHGCR